MQSINGQNLTVSMVLDNFYAKSAASPKPVKTKFDFMLRITNNVEQIKTKLEVPINFFMDSAKVNQILSKLPETMKIKGLNARTYLSDQIDSINLHQMETIKELNMDICFAFSNQLPYYDKTFNNWYQQWNKKPADKKHLQNIEQNRKKIGKIFEEFNGMFRNGMKTVNEASTLLSKYINLGRSTFDNIEKLKNPQEAVKAIVDLVPILEKISKQQEELIKSLGNVQSTLYLYNAQRIKWLDFLIELRKTPFSERQVITKEIELTYSLVLNRFYEKAARSGIVMKKKLDFILKISKNIDEIRRKLEVPVNMFLSDPEIGQISPKIPENLNILGRNARSYLLEEIELVNVLQIVIKELNDEICFGFSDKMLNKYDKSFDNWFKQWNPKSPNKSHVQLVEKYRKIMEIVYEKINKNFEMEINKVDDARQQCEDSIKFTKSSFNKELQSIITSEKAIKAIEQLGKLRKQQEQLIKFLGNVQSILHMYNVQRLKWMDFLIEYKETSTSKTGAANNRRR